MKQHSYLALGDSYTIGEQVRIHESFPYQTVQLLRKKGHAFFAPEIVAVTGFTTGELQQLVDDTLLMPRYDFVSLLIGVNNQYRSGSIEVFANEFETLLKCAIALANNNTSHVFVLSIPDWGVTAFAAGRDTKKIADEIDAFNGICRSVSEQYNIQYIDITTSQRTDGKEAVFLAPDQLHPSGKEYAKWAALLSEQMNKAL